MFLVTPPNGRDWQQPHHLTSSPLMLIWTSYLILLHNQSSTLTLTLILYHAHSYNMFPTHDTVGPGNVVHVDQPDTETTTILHNQGSNLGMPTSVTWITPDSGLAHISITIVLTIMTY